MTQTQTASLVHDRRARVSTSMAFAVQGLTFAAVIAQVPAFQTRFDLSNDALTAVLAGVPIIAGVGSVVAGAVASRWGSAVMLRIAGVGTGVFAAASGLSGAFPAFLVSVCLFAFFLGAVDATMNMQGVAVQRRYGRSLLGSFHSWWSIAGIASAAAAVATAELPIATYLVPAGAVAVVLALIAGPGLLKRADESPATSTPAEAAPPVKIGRTVWLVGIALMIMYLGDAATSSWAGVFVQKELTTNGFLVRSALFAYLIFQFVGRGIADRIIGRVGPVVTLVGGAVIAAIGFGAAAVAPQPWTALLGFSLVGLGLSVVVPLTFSAAGALDPNGSGVVIARVNLFNYAGVILGSALIGIVAEDLGLRVAFAVPAVAVLAILAFAPAFRVAAR